MHPFKYISPTNIYDAVNALQKYGKSAKPLAGGTDLLVQTRTGRLNLDAVIDIKNIPELNIIRKNGGLSFGAAVPCCRLYEDTDIASNWAGIIDAASLIGGIQIQSRAGFAGNLCNSSPSADGIGPLIVHDAKVIIACPSPTLRRIVPVEEFCTAPGQNVLKEGEMVIRIDMPQPSTGFGASYERFIPRNEMDIAVVGVAASVCLEGNKIRKAKIALAAVAPTPIVAVDASEYLIDKEISVKNIEKAAKLARNAIRPISDMRGTKEQREHLTEVLTVRMLNKSIERAMQD